MLRRLALRGFTVAGLTDNPSDPAARSRYRLKTECPDPTHDFAGWVAFMESIGNRTRKRPILIPTLDRYVLALDQAAARLSDRFRFHGFGAGLRSALTSKRQTFELADRHRFPMPASAFIENSEQLAAFCGKAPWPVLLKPDYAFQWHREAITAVTEYRPVLRARDAADLIAKYREIEPYCAGALAQEVVPGPDENLIYWAGFVGAGAKVGGRLVGRKLRTLPPHFGSATLVQLVDMLEVENTCGRFLQDLGYQGLCGIELKIDERDGSAKLIEINPRASLWDDIGATAGVDLAYEAVTALLGEAPAPKRVRDFRLKWVHFTDDLRAFRRYRAEEALTLGNWLRSLAPPIVVSDFPWRSDFPYAWSNFCALIGGAARLATSRSRL